MTPRGRETARATAALAKCLTRALLEFRDAHRWETPYAFALIGGHSGDYPGYAVATEEGLRRVALSYFTSGYRCGEARDDGDEEEQRDNLAAWLRWANPDDGWYLSDLPDQQELRPLLRALVDAGAFADDQYSFEEFSVDALGKLYEDGGWLAALAGQQVLLGFTWGEDPRDFLRAATRVNPYPLVRRLWSEVWRAESLESRILQI